MLTGNAICHRNPNWWIWCITTKNELRLHLNRPQWSSTRARARKHVTCARANIDKYAFMCGSNFYETNVTCCIVEDRFRYFTHQSGTTRHFPTFLTVFHGFLHFPPFTAHFCGKRHDFELERSVSEKIGTLSTKMCSEWRERGESVKNCRMAP